MPIAAALPAIASVVGAGAAVYSASKSGQAQTSTSQSNLNPGMQELLYGDGTKGGLLSYNQSFLTQPKMQGQNTFGQYADAYLGADAPYDQGQQRQTSTALATSNGIAPQMQAAQGLFTQPFNVAQSAFPGGNQGPQTANAQTANFNQINAPGQNGIGLDPAYNDFIYGQNGNNPYLAGAIQKGLNQSNANFQNLASDAEQNFKENILGSLRGDAIVNGQYGGSRQGIAEAKAADSLAKNMTRALSQVGQNQTDAAVSAQAGQYGQDRQNQLSALSGLSGNQYQVAGANAGAQNQLGLSNAQMLNNMGQFNAGVGNNYLAQLLQNNQFNAGSTNAANAMQYQGNQQMNMGNTNNQQQANQANMGSLFNMAQLNSQNKATGAGLLASLVNQNYQYGNNANDYELNRATKVNGLIAPYTGLGGSVTSSQPLYTNQGANALGGALAGAQLFKQFGSNFGGGGNSSGAGYANPADFPNGGYETTYGGT